MIAFITQCMVVFNYIKENSNYFKFKIIINNFLKEVNNKK